MRILGLDIGGANIKLATADGVTVSLPFALWKQPELLKSTLVDAAQGNFASPGVVALTMTAELADCFESKADGVTFVVRAVQDAFPAALIRVWLTSGEFADPDEAIDLPTLAAAGNWHALATWAGRSVPVGPALLVDIGSTTTDIIPLLDGQVISQGLTDLERLVHSELLYTGLVRTPVCAVVQSVVLEGDVVPVAAELFATMQDVHLITGTLDESPERHDTADGRPATRHYAMNRLAHMLCCDRDELSDMQLVEIAALIAEVQLKQIAGAIRNRLTYLSECLQSEREAAESVPAAMKAALNLSSGSRTTAEERPVLLLSGSGTRLARLALATDPRFAVAGDLESPILDFSEMYQGRITDAACAFAVARLAADRCADDLLPVEEFL